MLQFVNGSGRVAAKIFDCILVTEPVGTLDGVVHVPPPIVLAHIAERGRNATLRGDGVGTGRENLRDTSRAQTRLAASDHGAETGSAGAYDDDVIVVILNRISAAVDRSRAVRFSVLRHASDPEREFQNGVD